MGGIPWDIPNVDGCHYLTKLIQTSKSFENHKKERDEERRRVIRKQQKSQPNKFEAEAKNPCLKESQLSVKCMNDNGFDKEKCYYHFLNYERCKKFWNAVQSDRRSKGISPLLPPLEERDKIKAEFPFSG